MPDPRSSHSSPVEPVLVAVEPFVHGGSLASAQIPPAAHTLGLSELHNDEQTLAHTMADAQRPAFIAGRRALRAAMQSVMPTLPDVAFLRTSRGAPRIPSGFTGSISHKRTRAIALVAPSAGTLVGVDLEARPTARDAQKPSIADRILTGAERDALHGLDALAHREATLIRFAVKEAVYKSIDPYVHRYVCFTEVELDVHNDGSATVRLTLPEPSIQGIRVHAHWRLEDRWIIAMARSEPR